MKIAIDIDDTFTTNPSFFLELTHYLRGWGHQVGVLTNRTKENIPNGPWDYIVAYTEEQFKNESDVVSKVKWKSKMILENSIDILFDDLADLINKENIGNNKCIRVI